MKRISGGFNAEFIAGGGRSGPEPGPHPAIPGGVLFVLQLPPRPVTMSPLNSDIYQYIIDQLWDDRPTLAASSVVARSWRSASQSHLFSTILVYGYDTVSDNLDTFSEFLDQHPHICRYIRRLEIRGGKPQPQPPKDYGEAGSDSDSDSDFGEIDVTLNPPLILSTCFSTVSKLPKLVGLIISNALIQAEKCRTLPLNPPESLPSVLELELSVLMVTYPQTFVYWDIIRPFHNLQRLRMISLDEYRTCEAKPLSFPVLPLQHLAIRTAERGFTLRHLFDLQCLRFLTSLDVDSGCHNTSAVLNDVLKQYGEQVTDLVINPFGSEYFVCLWGQSTFGFYIILIASSPRS